MDVAGGVGNHSGDILTREIGAHRLVVPEALSPQSDQAHTGGDHDNGATEEEMAVAALCMH